VDLGTVTIDLCNGCGRVVLMNDREPDGRMQAGAAIPRCIFGRPDFEPVGDATQHRPWFKGVELIQIICDGR
jgi:hypothetical protein